MLRISDSNWVGVPVRILPKLWSVRSHVIRCARVQEPCARFLSRKQNFWFDWILYGQYVRVGRQYLGWRTDVVDFLMSGTPLISSLSFVGLWLEYPIVGLDVSWVLAVVADSGFPGLASASLICRRSGRTSTPIVRSVCRTLYYVSFFCRVFGEGLSPSGFCQDCARQVWMEYYNSLLKLGCFILTTLPFWLTDVPTIFQHMKNDIFKTLLTSATIFYYLEDIVIYVFAMFHNDCKNLTSMFVFITEVLVTIK